VGESMMKHFKSHLLLNINDQIHKDPVFIMCMKHVFHWANEMGLQGKRVADLRLVEPDPNEWNPLHQRSTIWCKIECTEEEETAFRKLREQQIKHNVLLQLSENE
jgi:hypothetical protein